MKSRLPVLLLVTLLVASAFTAPSASVMGAEGAGVGRGTDDDPVYVVIAPEGWRSTIQPLMDWRERTSGMTLAFLSLEEADTIGQGRDKAAKLKDAIVQVAGDGMAGGAILLVGDSEVIPVRKVFTDILLDGNFSDPLNQRWTDDYYAYGTESDWDRDGDGVYGEDGEVLDEIALVFEEGSRGNLATRQVGRIPASTDLEVERFIDKLLAYEQSPPPGDWYTGALLMSGLMDVPNHLDNPYTPDVDGGYELFSDNSLESHSRLVKLLPPDYDVTWLWDYPRLDGGHWNRSVDTLDHASAVAAFDQGHSIVAMNGHGWVDGSGLAQYNGSGYSTYWWDWQDAYTYADAANASNDGMLPWVYVAACYVGDITVAGDRSLERLVMNPSGGAVGLVAGNGENYKAESMANASFGNWFLEQRFWANYLVEGPGLAMHDTKTAYLALVSGDGVPHTPLYDAYYVADYLSPNLLGDPLTMVWTDVPTEVELGAVEDLSADGIDLVLLRIVDSVGGVVPDARVHVGWSGGAWEGWTDGSGEVRASVPIDAGEMEVVVSGRNLLPVKALMDRPVTSPDILVSGLGWGRGDDGELLRGPVASGEEVTLEAIVETRGRFGYDQLRVRFSVGPEGADPVRLVPDVFVTLQTGSVESATRAWTPPSPGRWTVRVEVDPDGGHPNTDPTNDVATAVLVVPGPPEWTSLPGTFHIVCGDAPGGSIPLLDHLTDPDTPLDELEITAEVVGPPIEGLAVHVDDEGRLWVCTDRTRAFVPVTLVASDGDFTDLATVSVDVDRGSTRLRIVADTVYALAEGATATGHLEVEDLGPGQVGGVSVVELEDDPDFQLLDGGDFQFQGRLPGTHLVHLGLQRADGTTDAGWQGLTLMFVVRPGAGLPPQAYGWMELRVAEGQEAKHQLQAVDLEGGKVTFGLVSDDGIDATIDPDTGVLTLRPGKGDVGKHTLSVSLSDGTSTEEVALDVYVTEAPSSGSLWGIAVVVVCLAAALLVALFLWLRQRRMEGSD